MSRLEKRVGICSQQFSNPEKHMLLWDFDYQPLSKIIYALLDVQEHYRLPEIYVIQSSPDSYHAYCFVLRDFIEIIHILSATPIIDITYLRLGMVRGYYTLRITSRPNEPKFSLVVKLPSKHKNEVQATDLTINEYFTSNLGGKHNAEAQ